MRPRPTLSLAMLLLALLALAPPVLGLPPSEGPFVGVVAQGQTNVHVYDNTPADGVCPQYFAPVPYTVTLAYSPPTDALTLQVVGRAVPVVGQHGLARVTIEGGGCEVLPIAVTGARVALLASYTVRVGFHEGGGASDS